MFHKQTNIAPRKRGCDSHSYTRSEKECSVFADSFLREVRLWGLYARQSTGSHLREENGADVEVQLHSRARLKHTRIHLRS